MKPNKRLTKPWCNELSSGAAALPKDQGVLVLKMERPGDRLLLASLEEFYENSQ